MIHMFKSLNNGFGILTCCSVLGSCLIESRGAKHGVLLVKQCSYRFLHNSKKPTRIKQWNEDKRKAKYKIKCNRIFC